MTQSQNKTQALYQAAKKLIPGGTQLFSKRPELHLPGRWPAYYDRAAGCEVWDLDGNRYLDMCYMGIAACILGYADPDVDAAAIAAITRGSACTLNCPEEVQLAEVLCELHPWAQMVRYARGGGEAITVALRIARARTRKDLVLFCGYHGWHDWYLAANLADDRRLDGHLLSGLHPAGVPRQLANTSLPFKYNDTSGFLKLLDEHRSEIAAVIMEPIRSAEPVAGFLQTVREETARSGIIMVFDEVSVGWRLATGGAHLKFGIVPDMAVFAKAISNGYPMAAVIGKADVMDAAQEAFISSTSWTERIGPSTALATIAKLRQYRVWEHLAHVGRRVQEGWADCAARHALKIDVAGVYPLGHFTFRQDQPLVLKTLFTQWMLEKGFLASTAYDASYAHKDEHVDLYLAAVDETFARIARAVAQGNAPALLTGPVCHAGFQRLA